MGTRLLPFQENRAPMRTLTLQPFLVLFLIGVAAMGLPVYQVCRREVGTMRIDAFRVKPSAWRNAFRRAMAAWRALFAQLLPATIALALVFAISQQIDADHSGVYCAASVLAVRMQERADLKKEGLPLAELAERTPEQEARLTTIEARIAVLDKEIPRLERFREDERAEGRQIAAAGAPRVEMGADRATLAPWGPEVRASASEMELTEARHVALGRFALAVQAHALGYGSDPRLLAAATGGGTQSDSNLGFAIPNEVAPGIERDMFETGDILGRVDARTITVGNSMTYNLIDQTSRADSSRGGGVLGYWVDEGTAPTQSNTKLQRMELKLRKVGAYGVLTDEVQADAAAIGGELETAFTEELVFQVENKIYRGNGSSAPLGILNAPCLVTVTKETGQLAGTIVLENLVKMWARVPARSKKNSVWTYNTDCGPQLHTMAQTIGTGGIAPRFVTYDASGNLQIFGRPAIEIEYAESVGTVGDIAVCDWKRYRLIRKGGVEQASSMHVYFAQGEQAFRAFYRVDGQAVPRAALTPFKGSATQSPFVVLGTRA
jgi:HK97 family phage major capsid protein